MLIMPGMEARKNSLTGGVFEKSAAEFILQKHSLKVHMVKSAPGYLLHNRAHSSSFPAGPGGGPDGTLRRPCLR